MFECVDYDDKKSVWYVVFRSFIIIMVNDTFNVDVVVSSAVMVLQRLVQVQLASRKTTTTTVRRMESQSPVEIVAHLARRIDDIKHPKARACVVWLVGQYAGVGEEGKMAEFAPDVLRKVGKTFVEESLVVKLQVVSLAGKLVVLCGEGGGEVEEKIGKLARYVFSLARYDKDWDVRDRGRFIGGLVGGFIGGAGSEGGLEERVGVVLRREQVRVVLFEGKQVGKEHDEEVDGVVGSFGRVRRGSREEELPDWMERGVESVLRDGEEGEVLMVPVTSSGGSTPPESSGGSTPKVDLETFYESEEESESDESVDSSTCA